MCETSSFVLNQLFPDQKERERLVRTLRNVHDIDGYDKQKLKEVVKKLGLNERSVVSGFTKKELCDLLNEALFNDQNASQIKSVNNINQN